MAGGRIIGDALLIPYSIYLDNVNVVRDEILRYSREHLEGVLIIDETGSLKKGDKS